MRIAPLTHIPIAQDSLKTFRYFAPLTLLVSLLAPESVLDIPPSYMLKNQLHAGALWLAGATFAGIVVMTVDPRVPKHLTATADGEPNTAVGRELALETS